MSEYMLRVHIKANVKWNNKAWFSFGVNSSWAGGLNRDIFKNPNGNDSESLTRKNWLG